MWYGEKKMQIKADTNQNALSAAAKPIEFIVKCQVDAESKDRSK